VVTFDDRVEHPADLGDGLVPATDRNRYRAVEHLARVEARGGTMLLEPLRAGLRLLAGSAVDEHRDRVLVLVTDGQVGNEDQVLREIAPLVGRTRVHAVGIDTAVNAGFLGRLAAVGAGRCELVESEDRLDEAMENIHQRIGAPVVTGLTLSADGLSLVDDTRTPAKLSAIHAGVPLVVAGRYRGPASGTLTLRGRTGDDREWSAAVAVQPRAERAVAQQWARAPLRDLEDRHVTGGRDLAAQIVETSLRYGVLCRFTAFVAVDTEVVADGEPHRVVQPVELPAGWQPSSAGAPVFTRAAFAAPIGTAHFTTSLAAPAPPPFAAPGAPMMAAPARSRRPAGPSGYATADATPASVPDASLRAIVAVEVERLREATSLHRVERRRLLADLSSRLVVLVDPNDPAQRPVVEALRLMRSADVDRTWPEIIRLLAEFAGDGAGRPRSAGSARPEKPGRRGSFWR
jgi:Ca-activated chloride channel homolog